MWKLKCYYTTFFEYILNKCIFTIDHQVMCAISDIVIIMGKKFLRSIFKPQTKIKEFRQLFIF